MSVREVIVRLTDFAPSCPRLCFSHTLHVLLRSCRPIASLEAIYLLNPSNNICFLVFFLASIRFLSLLSIFRNY